MIRFKTILETFIKALFPQRCIVCYKLSVTDSFFCKDCEGKIEPIADRVCTKCGCEQKRCDCDRFIYHFDGAVACFKNEGQAKKSFYTFKFGSNISAADYFVGQMVSIFKRYFSDIKIDLICYVPLSKTQLKTRQTDKCKLLAEGVSTALQIPLKTIIVKRENVSTQHSLTLDNRFYNVRDAYTVTEKSKNKNVLLIDDIKTTGATLDACAKELKFAGANSVYCLTVLTGQKD